MAMKWDYRGRLEATVPADPSRTTWSTAQPNESEGISFALYRDQLRLGLDGIVREAVTIVAAHVDPVGTCVGRWHRAKIMIKIPSGFLVITSLRGDTVSPSR